MQAEKHRCSIRVAIGGGYLAYSIARAGKAEIAQSRAGRTTPLKITTRSQHNIRLVKNPQTITPQTPKVYPTKPPALQLDAHTQHVVTYSYTKPQAIRKAQRSLYEKVRNSDFV